MPSSQVNARVSAHVQQILEAASYAYGKSIGELIRPAVEALAAELEADPPVRTALRAKKEAAAAQEGALPTSDPRDGLDV